MDSSVAVNGEFPVSLRESVVIGMPVRSAATRCEIPAALRALETAWEMPRESACGVSMWATVVPMWIHRKARHAETSGNKYLHGYLRYLRWVYCVGMNAANARERSAYSDAVAGQIRAERNRAKKTQKAVFEAAGIPRQTYLRIESGARVTDTTQLARICSALGIPLSTLFARVEEVLDSQN
jgi:DNA-binding XRE family transcriptional regulator